ncbi:MAG TPA: helix-turn-helix transcriptional regulator [Streptosporangiaceae bacterium]|nr:helix-turn-helix transcriptional regulator [Streptosporangiaceae bacterium]
MVSCVLVASARGDDQPDPAPLGPAGPQSRPRATSSNPTIRQRELGLRMRELRNEHGMTVEAVAGHLLCSATKISRMETGSRRASQRDVRDLCELYEVSDPDQREYLMGLARQSREAGWWNQYDDLSLNPFIGLEDEASAVTSWSMYYVPGLLQTAEYARAIILGIMPRVSPQVLDQRVEARLKRQLILDRSTAPSYRAIMDEAVLHRNVGGEGVMRNQLDKLLERSESQQVVIQVIPFGAGAHSGAESNFDLLEFSDDILQGPVVYVEGLVGNLYFERQLDIRRYREAIDNLRDAALGARDSIALISQIRADEASAR